MNILLTILFLSEPYFLSLKKDSILEGTFFGKLRDIYIFTQEKKEIKKKFEKIKVPLSLYPFYREAGFMNAEPEPGEYLIITNSSFLSLMDEFILWKQKCGYKVVAEIITGSEPPQTIKNIITSHYQNDTPKTEYVLLVGDVNLISPFYGYPWSISDNKFVTMDGDSDYIPEILIGRISVSNSGELLSYLSKILNYEKNPEISDTLWYHRSLMIAAHYPQNVWTPLRTKKWIRQFLLNSNLFYQVDSIYYPPTSNGVGPITSSVDNGVLFLNYRGGDAESKRWIYPLFEYQDIDGLSNGYKLPIITSFVCLTGAFDDNSPMCLGEKWIRAGTPTNMKGGVAFIGSGSGGTHTRGNNALDEAFYKGYAEDSFPSLASLLLYAKLNLISHLPNNPDPDSGVGFYFHTYNILGDPSLILYKGAPKNVTVTLPSTLALGTSSISVNVKRNGNPLKDAWVSVFKQNEARDFSLTDENGNAFLEFNPLTAGTLYVTVRGFDVYPQILEIPVSQTPYFIGIQSLSFSDSIGHGDTLLTPSEIIKLNLSLRNYGSQTTNNVTAKLSSSDPFINITDSLKSMGNFSSGQVKNTSFKFQILPQCTTSHEIKFNMSITSNQGNWIHYIKRDCYAPEFEIDSIYVIDADGYPDPGDTENLVIVFKNTGDFTGYNVAGTLKSLSSKIQVIDSTSNFGNINIDSTSSNYQNPFTIDISGNAFPGEEIPMQIRWSTQAEGEGRISFPLKIGAPSPSNATGPSEYGYYVLDDQDSLFQEKPEFSWIEIDPGFGGNGAPLNLKNDSTVTVNLPFTFKYFGIDHTSISISDNGYFIFGNSNASDPYNWPVPAVTLPDGFVAVFWDDFDPEVTDSSRDVYVYHDNTNHLFIIEWSRVQHIHNYQNPVPSELATFEAILYDPSYYPTSTGDGIINIQFLDVQDDDQWHNYSTTGFESQNHSDGIQLSFNGTRANGIPTIEGGRAFLITPENPSLSVKEGKKRIQDKIFIPSIIRNSFIFYTPEVFKNSKFTIVDVTGRKIYQNILKSKFLKLDRKIFRKNGVFYLILNQKKNIIKKIIYLK